MILIPWCSVMNFVCTEFGLKFRRNSNSRIKFNEFRVFLDNLVLSFSEFYMITVLLWSTSVLYHLWPAAWVQQKFQKPYHFTCFINAFPLERWQIPALISVAFHCFWISGLTLLFNNINILVGQRSFLLKCHACRYSCQLTFFLQSRLLICFCSRGWKSWTT